MENTIALPTQPATADGLPFSCLYDATIHALRLTQQQAYHLPRLAPIPGIEMDGTLTRRSTSDYEGFPLNAVLMRYDGELFVVDLLFIEGDKWYTLRHLDKGGNLSWSDHPSRYWVHENYVQIGVKS